jgi:Raf kinase inhibitor-like YbhB/YbcL family protein
VHGEDSVKLWAIVTGAAVALVPAGCKQGVLEPSAPPGVSVESLSVTSRSFPSGGQIPVDFTCDGANKSPQLTWSAPPRDTQSFAVVAEDPDAPGGTFTHWMAYDIAADTRELPEGVDLATVGGASGLNDNKRPGYSGPCPPQLEVHHYLFRVYALNTAHLTVGPEPDRDAFDAALNGHVLGTGALVGTFSH